jgi:hypothetical protein
VAERVESVFLERGARLCGGPVWRVDNPGAQWTGSVSPILEHPSKVFTFFFLFFFASLIAM